MSGTGVHVDTESEMFRDTTDREQVRIGNCLSEREFETACVTAYDARLDAVPNGGKTSAGAAPLDLIEGRRSSRPD
ncbi:hypothetical protein AB3X94_41265 [Paraburkholderia sp. BR10923]